MMLSVFLKQAGTLSFSSSKLYETQVAEKNGELKLSQHEQTLLNVFPCDNVELIISCQVGQWTPEKLTNLFRTTNRLLALLPYMLIESSGEKTD